MAMPARLNRPVLRLWERLPSAATSIRSLWQRIRSWRRIRFTQAGAVFTAGSFAVGFAAFNTGNNLLYLLWGAMLGLIVVSSWLSEQVIRDLRIFRRTPRGVTVGNPVRIHYEVENLRRRIPSLALEVGEEDLPGTAFLPSLIPGSRAVIRSENRFSRRGVFKLQAVTVSTSFPFGLFRKSRDIPQGGELVIWPRADRRVRPPAPSGGRNPRTGSLVTGSSGPRGEYRGLRDYRPGDDPRDIHWRTSARLGHPVVREYEQHDAETLWVCLDRGGEPGDRAEVAVEMAASLAAGAFRDGRRFAFVAHGMTVEPGQGPRQMERILDALARVDFSREGERPVPPVARRGCVLVTLRPGDGGGFGDVYSPGQGSSSSPTAPPTPAEGRE